MEMTNQFALALFLIVGSFFYAAGFSSALNKSAEYGVEFWCDHPGAYFAWVCDEGYVFREGR